MMDGMKDSGGQVLVIDDEPVVIDVLRDVLDRQGYRIESGPDAATCRRLIESGDEWDVLLQRPINKYVDVLAKYAYFRSASGSPRPDVQRVWVQATVKF